MVTSGLAPADVVLGVTLKLLTVTSAAAALGSANAAATAIPKTSAPSRSLTITSPPSALRAVRIGHHEPNLRRQRGPQPLLLTHVGADEGHRGAGREPAAQPRRPVRKGDRAGGGRRSQLRSLPARGDRGGGRRARAVSARARRGGGPAGAGAGECRRRRG